MPLGGCLQDIGQCVGNRLAFERDPAGEHLVQDTAERPDIAALIGRLSAGLFGTHISRRADHPSRLGYGALLVLRFAPNYFSQAEVQDLDLALRRNLDIAGL